MLSPWTLLGLPAGSPSQDVRRQYKVLALRWHPDKNPGKQELATRKMIELQQAYKKIVKELESSTTTSYGSTAFATRPTAPSPFTYTTPKVYTTWSTSQGQAERPKRKEKPKPQKGPKAKFNGNKFKPFEKARRAEQSKADEHPAHLTFEALSNLNKDSKASAVLAEARAEPFLQRYNLKNQPNHRLAMEYLLGAAARLRRFAEAANSQLFDRYASCLNGDMDKWWDEPYLLQRSYDDISARSRQASQLEMWLGELTDWLEGDLDRNQTEEAWNEEFERLQNIGRFVQRIKGVGKF